MLVSQRMADSYSAMTLIAHQHRYDCLVSQIKILSACHGVDNLLPEDFDFCAEAVNVCKRKGFYRAVEHEDQLMGMWKSAELFLRWIFIVLSMFVFTCFLGLFTSKYLSMNRRES